MSTPVDFTSSTLLDSLDELVFTANHASQPAQAIRLPRTDFATLLRLTSQDPSQRDHRLGPVLFRLKGFIDYVLISPSDLAVMITIAREALGIISLDEALQRS